MIKKAVFPVAGFGTRFLPATKATPKEMLPIVDKPLIQYAVEEAIAAGISELIFITNSNKRAIEDHFDRHFELEHHLFLQKKIDILAQVEKIIPSSVKCIYIRQPEARGLGHAVACAAPLMNNEPFAVILADDLIDAKPGCLQQMVAYFQEKKHYPIAVQWVDPARVDRYGIVSIDPCKQIRAIVEKPRIEDAPSQWGVVGRYILPPEILPVLEKISPKIHGEIQLTDAIAELLPSIPFDAYPFDGIRYDCGDKLEYLKATLQYGLHHPEVGKAFARYLQEKLAPAMALESQRQ